MSDYVCEYRGHTVVVNPGEGDATEEIVVTNNDHQFTVTGHAWQTPDELIQLVDEEIDANG